MKKFALVFVALFALSAVSFADGETGTTPTTPSNSGSMAPRTNSKHKKPHNKKKAPKTDNSTGAAQ